MRHVFGSGPPGVLSGLQGGYAARLREQGFTEKTILFRLKEFRRMGRWMVAVALSPADLRELLAEDYLRWCVSQGYSVVVAGRQVRRSIWIIRDLVGLEPEPPADPDPVDEIVAGYRSWLVDVRGLSEATVCRYVRGAGLFLRWAGVVTGGAEALTAQVIVAFLLGEVQRQSRDSAKGRVAELRSLLRFMYQRGLIATALGESISPVASWRLVSLPTGPSAEEVEAVIAGCPDSAAGRRDRILLMLAARLGLRSVEIARLTLDDIDWRGQRITVRGKAGRVDQMPLPGPLARLLADYVLHDRGRPGGREVFWTVRAPIGPINPALVGDATQRACRRLGFDPFGPHQLRHSLARKILAGRGDLMQVAQVLRHDDLATTAVYAKVDFGMLSEAVAAWPQVTP